MNFYWAQRQKRWTMSARATQSVGFYTTAIFPHSKATRTKILKTGCRYEDLQLRTGHALLNALCVLIPVARILLQLRWVERTQPETPASEILTTTQIEVLVRHSTGRARLLPSQLTVRQALWAIAALGGHLAHNGPPGVLTLLRGFHTLLRMEEAVLALNGQLRAEM
jgi:hypothetical protein